MKEKLVGKVRSFSSDKSWGSSLHEMETPSDDDFFFFFCAIFSKFGVNNLYSGEKKFKGFTQRKKLLYSITRARKERI